MSVRGAWLMLIDLQRIFGEPVSEWCTPDFAGALAGSVRLRERFTGRVALTRFLAPTRPAGAWVPYYERWSFALDPASAALYNLVAEVPVHAAVVIERTTFGKWDTAAAEALDEPTDIVLAGVSTDCCVLATALAAADAGVRVHVAADACAGLSVADHQRALDVMALYAPLIEITTVEEVLDSLG